MHLLVTIHLVGCTKHRYTQNMTTETNKGRIQDFIERGAQPVHTHAKVLTTPTKILNHAPSRVLKLKELASFCKVSVNFVVGTFKSRWQAHLHVPCLEGYYIYMYMYRLYHEVEVST